MRNRLFGQRVVVKLRVLDPALIELVRSLPFVHNVDQEDNRLFLQMDDPETQTPIIIRKLVEAGGDILSVVEEQHSLSDVYMRLMGPDRGRQPVMRSIRAIIAKELADILRNRMLVFSSLIPSVVFLVIPFLVGMSAGNVNSRKGLPPGQMSQLLLQVSPELGRPATEVMSGADLRFPDVRGVPAHDSGDYRAGNRVVQHYWREANAKSRTPAGNTDHFGTTDDREEPERGIASGIADLGCLRTVRHWDKLHCAAQRASQCAERRLPS